MTPIPEIILKLQNAAAGNRRLDAEIALAVGYRKELKPGKKPNHQWFLPSGEALTKVPLFTKSMEAARIFALMFIPDCVGGFTWNERFATAQINDGPRYTAADPSLALCAAALSAIYEKQRSGE